MKCVPPAGACRATPINPTLLGSLPRTWGDAVSSTPMYTEEVETLVYKTTAKSMWNLFLPFSWQLWVAIASMVRTHASLYCTRASCIP